MNQSQKDISKSQHDLKQQFKNAKEGLQQNMGMPMKKSDEAHQRMDAMKQEVVEVKTELKDKLTDMNIIKKKIEDEEIGRADELERIKKDIRKIRRGIQQKFDETASSGVVKAEERGFGKIKLPTYDDSVSWTVYLKQF